MAGDLNLNMVFGTAGVIDTKIFSVLSADSVKVRNIGETIGKSKIVARYDDPVWTIKMRLGPQVPTNGLLLRRSIGTFFTFLISDSAGKVRPDAEIWIGRRILAEMLNCKQSRLGKDITRGERYELTFQFPESRVP